MSDLKTFSISNIFASAASFDGTISLLRYMGFVSLRDDYLILNSESFDPLKFDSEHYFNQTHFFRALFSKLTTDLSGKNFLNRDNLRFDNNRNAYYVRSHLIEFRFFPLRNVLLRLGFLIPDETITNHLFVPEVFTELLTQNFVAEIQRKDKKRRLSITQLKARMNANDELGRKGELFVLDFERNRLSNRRNLESVQRISEDYVNAGFDIESYDNEHSIVLDRFIEVKTYSNEISFYWSSNEIEAAKKLENDYWLYLVHSRSMENPHYVPQMFQNPYRAIFLSELWAREAFSWKFKYVDPADSRQAVRSSRIRRPKASRRA